MTSCIDYCDKACQHLRLMRQCCAALVPLYIFELSSCKALGTGKGVRVRGPCRSRYRLSRLLSTFQGHRSAPAQRHAASARYTDEAPTASLSRQPHAAAAQRQTKRSRPARRRRDAVNHGRAQGP